ncbi:MAG: flavin reductase family protein [Pseudomonadota bacterium]|nr:flavin reductase family protein [Pseudomonadota bacterium]
MSFSQRDFRNALGCFPTGVTVVTARSAAGYNIGVTVNSFSSVSLEPALISFNLGKHLMSLQDLLDARAFAVNILQDCQGHLSGSFARQNSDKWSGIEYVPGQTGCPVLASNLATFECEPHAHHTAGDHVIIVGRVLHISTDPDAEPLVFYRGQYRVLGGRPDGEEQVSA